jgi:5-methylthioadenosine/S-adenosylhomocysteine deaminase
MGTATTAEGGAAGSTTRYLAAAVVLGDRAGTVHRPGVVDVAGGEIRWVGPPESAPPPPATVVDVGGVLLPGMVNTHAHTPMTLVRGEGDGLPLARWLAEAVWPLEAELSDDDVRWGMRLGAAELLTNGVTTSCEQYARPRPVAEAALESGIRCLQAPAVFGDGGPRSGWGRALEEAEEVHGEFHGKDGRLTVGLGPHSAYTLSAEGLVATAELAGRLGAPIMIHVAETEAEEAQVRALHGCGTVELLERLGVLDQRVVAAHSVWLSDADLDRYVAHGVAVAHCPKSNAKLGSGMARLADLLARGIAVGLGTDGPASNDTLDLWEEMRMAALLARARAADAALVPTAEALWLATGSGAGALGLATGILEPGRVADMVRVDLADPRLSPIGDDRQLLSHLVWAAGSRLVTDVWVGGAQVVRAGRCVTIDVDEARREVEARAARLRLAARTGSGGH